LYAWIIAQPAPIKVGAFQVGQKVIGCNIRNCPRPRSQAEVRTPDHKHGSHPESVGYQEGFWLLARVWLQVILQIRGFQWLMHATLADRFVAVIYWVQPRLMYRSWEEERRAGRPSFILMIGNEMTKCVDLWSQPPEKIQCRNLVENASAFIFLGEPPGRGGKRGWLSGRVHCVLEALLQYYRKCPTQR
jgi:hypothetical protein